MVNILKFYIYNEPLVNLFHDEWKIKELYNENRK